MKRSLVLLLVVALVAIPALAQDTHAKPKIEVPWTFRAMQVNFTAMSWGDYLMTSWALRSGGYGEANPLAKWYVEKPQLAVPILAGVDLLVNWQTDALYRDGHKTVAWILVIGLNAARAYILIHNLRQAR
jgi:hypothetical protein